MAGGGLQQGSNDAARNLGALTAHRMAEAVVRAAMATGELSLLAYRDEQALKGHVAFRARWVAFAALTQLCPAIPPSLIARPLGCGMRAAASLERMRAQPWWDEAVADRLFHDLKGAGDRRPLTGLDGLLAAVAGICGDLMISTPSERPTTCKRNAA